MLFFLRRFLYVTCVISRTERNRRDPGKLSLFHIGFVLRKIKALKSLYEFAPRPNCNHCCSSVGMYHCRQSKHDDRVQHTSLRYCARWLVRNLRLLFFSDGRSFLHDKTNFPKVKQHFTVVTGNHAYTGFPLCKSRSHQQGEK